MQTITHLNFAKGFRGGERQTLLLVESLAQKGYTQTLVTRKNAPLAQKASKIKNLTIICILKPYFLSIPKIRKSDIIHAHETKAAHFAYFTHLIYKIPYILTRRIDQTIRASFLNKKVYLHSKKTVAISSVIQEKVHTLDKHINTSIIPDALSHLSTDKESSNTINQRFKDKFLIGHIGELDNEDKGQHYLIEVAKKLQNSHPYIHFLLLGKGKDEQHFKLQTEHLDNITFEGYVNNVGDYIPNFNLFVFPSLREGLGSILLDIMVFSIPIIATKVGGIPDIINHDKNGLLIPPHDSDALEKAILKLYKDKNLASSLSKKAKEDSTMYTAEKMRERYITLYKEHS